MNVRSKSSERNSILFESILALAIPIISLTTAIVNLTKAIVESKKEQKNNRHFKLWLV